MKIDLTISHNFSSVKNTHVQIIQTVIKYHNTNSSERFKNIKYLTIYIYIFLIFHYCNIYFFLYFMYLNRFNAKFYSQ